MNLILRTLNQNGTDRIEVVIVTASKRACPCFGHLKGRQEKTHDNTLSKTEAEMTLRPLNMQSRQMSVQWNQSNIVLSSASFKCMSNNKPFWSCRSLHRFAVEYKNYTMLHNYAVKVSVQNIITILPLRQGHGCYWKSYHLDQIQ